ncbi:hypothetical protein N7540_013213 [Penicillium herquei]|nr:hypothetical protein N7540_013213 [Penicillium herquei]
MVHLDFDLKRLRYSNTANLTRYYESVIKKLSSESQQNVFEELKRNLREPKEIIGIFGGEIESAKRKRPSQSPEKKQITKTAEDEENVKVVSELVRMLRSDTECFVLVATKTLKQTEEELWAMLAVRLREKMYENGDLGNQGEVLPPKDLVF